MADNYNEARKRALAKYMEDKVQIKITVTPDKRDLYQQMAADRGLSLTQLITDLLEGKKMSRIYVADRETGTFMDEVKTVEEGLEMIKVYCEDDVNNGEDYDPDFYDIVDADHVSLIHGITQHELEVKILMADGCNRNEAERFLKRGTVIYDTKDIRLHFDQYWAEYEDLDEEEKEVYYEMLKGGRCVADWSRVELYNKRYLIAYVN